MKRITQLPILLVVLIFCPSLVLAANLMQVYRDACANDPTFKAAKAEFDALSQDIPIAVANFLPQLYATGRLQRDRTDNDFPQTATPTAFSAEDEPFYNNTAQYSLSADQSIFNFANWAKLSTARATVRQAAANLNAAAQDLMIRTATAYFALLNSSDDLRFTLSEKKAIARQLQQNIERYRVGLIAITAVYETQASYDAVVSREIATRNEFANRIEELREITGKSYRAIKGAKKEIPLITPRPAKIDRWVSIAEKNNYTLLAANYGTQAAQENIKLQFSGHLPVVGADASYNYTYQNNQFGLGFEKTRKALIGVNGTLPVFSGGATTALTRQARYYYIQACALREKTYRAVVSGTRKAYLGVLSGISRVKADRQAIVSFDSAFKANEAAYEVGTRTMADVLDAQSKLYDAQRITSRDQYLYLFDTLSLKREAGTLSPRDLAAINRYFNTSIPMLSYTTIEHVKIPKHTIPQPIKLSKKKSTIQLAKRKK